MSISIVKKKSELILSIFWVVEIKNRQKLSKYINFFLNETSKCLNSSLVAFIYRLVNGLLLPLVYTKAMLL